MGRNALSPGDLALILGNGASIAVVEHPPTEPLHVARHVHDMRVRRVGETQYDIVVFTSAQSGATVPLEFQDPVAVLLPVATAFEVLHSIDKTHALVHGNLTLDAISMVDGIVVISGFEHCCIHPGQPGSTDRKHWAPPGHLPSMAPELATREARTMETDVYAFGMLIFRMYAGKYALDEVQPWDHLRVAAMARLCNGERPPREDIVHERFTDELWTLMTQCWAQEPSDRPTMASVRARLAQMV